MTGPVRSVSLSFAILRLLAGTGPLPLSEIGRTLGLSPSSCLNLMRTLVEEGAVERGERGKQYRLTRSWAAFAALQTGAAQALIARARPVIAALARRCGATTALWRRQDDDRLHLVARADSGAEMRIHLVEGQRQPLASGAAGRSILAAANLQPAAIEATFAAVRWHRAPSFADYLRQITEVRATGFAVDDGQAHAGICTVAAALPHALPEFCVSISIFSGSHSAEQVNELSHALVALAHEPALAISAPR